MEDTQPPGPGPTAWYSVTSADWQVPLSLPVALTVWATHHVSLLWFPAPPQVGQRNSFKARTKLLRKKDLARDNEEVWRLAGRESGQERGP